MKTHRFLAVAWTLGLILLVGLARAQAQSPYTSYQLENIQGQTMRGGWANAQQGGLQVLGADATASGGAYHVRSLVNGCEWRFAWTFSQGNFPADVAQISYGRGELAAVLRIESSGGACATNFNPFVEFRADGDPTMPVYGPNEVYAGRFCLQAGGHCNQRSSQRRFKIYRQTSVKDTAQFEVNLFLPAHAGYGQHVQSISYQYRGVSGAPESVSRLGEFCFAADPGAGLTDRNAHYSWAQRQGGHQLRSNLAFKLNLLARCRAISDAQLASAFATISVIIARYVPNASCFNGDQGATSTDWSAHKNWAASIGRQQSVSNLQWKTAAAFRCLDRSGQTGYFSDVSVVIASAPVAS
jgi:hypothetical protein